MTTHIPMCAVGVCLTALFLAGATQAGGVKKTDGPVKPGKKIKGEEKSKPLLVNDQLTRANLSKTYDYRMVPGKSYVITLVSNQFDAFLRLQDPNGRQLAADDDGGGNLNSRIVYTPTKAGKYRIVASSLGGGSTGAYVLTVTPQGKPQQLLNIKGQLTTSEPMDYVRSQCYFKVYKVKLIAGKSYVIDLIGNYDPYLRLEDFRGNNRMQDDDGGGNLNARIHYIPQMTEEYRIIVTSCSSQRTGNYQLIVTQR